MVIDDITAHNPKHLCIEMMRKNAMVIDDITAHVNPKHLLYDETMCYSARIGVKTDRRFAKNLQKHFSNEMKIHFFIEDTHYPERFPNASTFT
jgi:hypothetical protein